MIREREIGRFSRAKGREAVVARYGTTRSFALRTLYTWLTLTMLYTFTWPLLVLLTPAPGLPPEETPMDWFQLRFLAPALTGMFAAWLWRLSPAPADTAKGGRMLALFRRGWVWPQALVFLLGLGIAVSALALVDDPAGAFKLIALALADAVVIQILLSGYMRAAFDLLFPGGRAGALITLLYALTFATRGALAAAAGETLAQGELILSVAGGIVVGALIGAVSNWLRDRSGSVLPGILALWLVFLLLGLPEFYDT